MTDLRDAGVVSAIGLGVNEIAICEASLAHADLDLLMIAGRYTLLEQEAEPFLARCAAQGIGLIGAGVFNSGILATGTRGGPAHYDYHVAPEEVIGRVAAIERCCEQFSVPLPAAALQFAAAHPAIATVVLGTGSPDRIKQAANLIQLPIPNAFWEALRAKSLVSGDCPTPSA